MASQLWPSTQGYGVSRGLCSDLTVGPYVVQSPAARPAPSGPRCSCACRIDTTLDAARGEGAPKKPAIPHMCSLRLHLNLYKCLELAIIKIWK